MMQQGRDRTVTSQSPQPSLFIPLLLPLHLLSMPQRDPKGRCCPVLSPPPMRRLYPQEPGAEALTPAPTPPKWVPWKPASFPPWKNLPALLTSSQKMGFDSYPPTERASPWRRRYTEAS